MATVKQQGKGYKITISQGFDYQGKRIRQHMTWVPSPGMTKRQIEKELARQTILFEERVTSGAVMVNGSIKFSEFSEKFMQDYGRLQLKPKTVVTYTENLVRINQAIGHIKLSELRTGHINAFYKNLQEEGIRNRITATTKVDLRAMICTKRGALTAFAAKSGVSRGTLDRAMLGKPISKESAETIAAGLDSSLQKLFTVDKHTEPLAPSTVLAYHRTLKAILAKAVTWGYIQINPATAAEKPKLEKKEAAYLDEPSARHLLELLKAEPIRWRIILMLDLLSGLRRGEILGLRWPDVDFESSTITIRTTSNYLPGKGVYTGTPKSARSARPLLLSSGAMQLLKEYKGWQDAQKEKLGDAWENEEGWVFTNDFGVRVFPDSVTKWFSNFIARSGLPKVTVHSLRHTYATLMIADGVSTPVVSRQLGHAQASTTLNIYAHAIAAAEAKAMATFDRFNDVLGAPQA